LVVSCFVVSVLGHAVMRDPTPLNPNPTTSQPCGVTALPTGPTAGAMWAAGNSYSIVWQLIATDGGTMVYGAFDPTGTGATDSSFSVSAWTTPFQMNNGLATYTYTFQMPSGVTCTGPNGLCLFRMYTDTNWNSCLFVNVTNCADCPQPPTPPPVCKTATDLTFCTASNNKGVYIPSDESPDVIDATLRNVFWANINNTRVFADGTSETCRSDYLNFLCALDLPPCPGSNETVAVGAACHGMCVQATTACQLTTIHENLYNCSSYPLCPGEVASDADSRLPQIVLIAVAVIVVALMM